MLGADGPRTYLVLFTTPSESRGLGGFVGSYAELTVDDGQLASSQFGRAQDLDAAAAGRSARQPARTTSCERYGRFGFDTDGDGLVGDAGVPQPGDDAELPVGRGDRRRPLHPDHRAARSTA